MLALHNDEEAKNLQFTVEIYFDSCGREEIEEGRGLLLGLAGKKETPSDFP